ncbi:glycosyltransferase family 39 protein [Sphaerothrix gracilis]|uniref:glycosyltransferase family 39 protein n=1 Tax=Sphaerothrix gracilis TaxID=3151835 RepID=UPI0031FC45DF
MPKLKQVDAALSFDYWLYSLLAIGCLLRLHQYLLDRSLWIDEAFLALNITERTYSELFQPLTYNQATPVGFLVVEKFLTQIFNNGEYALRLLPFLSSLLALFLFFKLARILFHRRSLAIPIALGLFVLCDRLIYYSAEVKQYSTDVAIAVLICLLAFRLKSERLSWTTTAGFAVVAALSVWISHPSVFILAGTGLCLMVPAILERSRQLIKYAVAYGFGAVSFILFYQISLKGLVSNSQLQESWGGSHNAFMPLPPTSLTELKWFFDTFFTFFDYPVGIALQGIAALYFLLGCVVLFKTRRFTFSMLVLPLALVLLASGLQKYPFKGQLLLFIVPFVLLIIGAGGEEIFNKIRSGSQLIALLLVLLLFSHPLYYAALNLKDPSSPPRFEYQRVREDIKPVLGYLQDHWQKGDTLYLYYAAQYAFRYYAERYGFDIKLPPPSATYQGDWFEPALVSDPPHLIVGSVTRYEPDAFEPDLRQISQYRRVWTLFAHVHDRRSSIDEETVLLRLLAQVGQQVDEFQRLEASVYLFEMDER